MRNEKAEYHKAVLPEHRGNPLIEALPIKVNDELVIEKLGFYPSYEADVRGLDALDRADYLTRLKRLRQPLPIYLECFRAIELAIKDGYSSKNPFSPTTMNYLYYPVNEKTEVEPKTGYFQPRGCGMTLIGESGVGKTSMLEQILWCYPDVIEHKCYQDRSLPIKQVIWIKVDCPDDSSVKAICYKILTELDIKLGNQTTKPQATIPQLLSQIEALIKSSFLGILVIDEMQNLNLAKAGGADRLLAFLHNLVNNLGIPLLFCANPPFNELLAKSLKDARRAESSGYFAAKLLEYDELWWLFAEELWELQWTNVETPLTEGLCKKLHELSIGNIDLAVKIYRQAQLLVIGTDNESINEAVLEHASEVAIQASRKAVMEIQQNIELSKFQRRNKVKEQKHRTLLKPETLQHQKLVTIPGDLSRCQHPEFYNQISAILQEDYLIDRVADPDLFQRASETDSPLSIISKGNLVCEDLFNH